MSEYITLIGAEDVRIAGNRMADAAHTVSAAARSIDTAADRMRDAAAKIDAAVENHAVYLNEFIANLKAIMGADHA